MPKTPKRSFRLSAGTKLLPSSIPEPRAPSVGEGTSSYVYTSSPYVRSVLISLLTLLSQKNAAPTTKPKKGEVLKATRIPKNQLLDLIFDCFRQYQYWSMKALRQRTQQPDSYLRQVLEEVAVLNKSGPFANHYCLSEAYRDKGGNDAKEAAAEAMDDDGDDDEGEEMEDVLVMQ
jgi:hypothetical protein